MLSRKKYHLAAGICLLLALALSSCKSSKNCDCPSWGKAEQKSKEAKV